MEHRDVCFDIENDDFYRRALNGLARAPAEGLDGPSKIERLNRGIEQLTLELERQVAAEHRGLLTQAGHATGLETAIGRMRVEAQGLLAGVERLRARLLTPYAVAEAHSRVLGRVQRLVHLLRQARKVLHLSDVLRQLQANPTVQARLLYELRQIIAEADFADVEFLTEDLRYIQNLETNLVDDTSQRLQKGLADSDKSLLLSAFNILNNLHCAKNKIDDIVSSELQALTHNIQSSFNVSIEMKKQADNKGPGRANIVNPQVFKQSLWENIEKLFDEIIYASCKKIILLQNSLDDLHSFENFRFVADGFWNRLSDIFSAELKNSSIAVNQCVENEFPKLLKCYNDLCSKLHYKHFTLKRESLSAWENAFLSQCLTKLLDPVRTMWQSSHVPTLEQVDEVVRAISSILSVSLGDRQLGVSLAQSVAKCIKQLSTEAEERITMNRDAGQVVEPPTTVQQRNANLSNVLYYFSKQINRVMLNMLHVLSAECINVIQESVKDVLNISILQPFCITIKASVDLILGSMHSESENSNTAQPVTSTCSAYMKELEQFLKRCKEIYLSMYEDKSAVNRACEDISSYCVKMFIFNVCCVRPISPYRRKKLAHDCQHLIHVLTPYAENNSNADQLLLLRELQVINFLITSTPAGIVDYLNKGVTLPYSLVLFYLFSYASVDFLSPYECVNWTKQDFVVWLYKHPSEKDRLDFITGALQRYENFVRQNKIDKYDDIFPILCNLVQSKQKDLCLKF